MDGLRTCARIQLTALLRCRGRVATSTAGNAVFLLCEARLYTSPSLPSPPTDARLSRMTHTRLAHGFPGSIPVGGTTATMVCGFESRTWSS
jgi:hypothetical protein